MKEQMTRLVALWFAGWGGCTLLFPQWSCQAAGPERAHRERKWLRMLGGFLFLAGLVLLASGILG